MPTAAPIWLCNKKAGEILIMALLGVAEADMLFLGRTGGI